MPGAKRKRQGQKKLFCTVQSTSGDLFAERLEHAPALEPGLEIWQGGQMLHQGFAMGLSIASHPGKPPCPHHLPLGCGTSLLLPVPMLSELSDPCLVPFGFTAPLTSHGPVSTVGDHRISIFL